MSDFLLDDLKDRFAGSAIGSFVGDAMGMPVEGWPAFLIEARFGILDRLLPGRLPAGSYTDDTQMMISIMEVIRETGDVDPQLLAERFAANFDPLRGYGTRIPGVMERIKEGLPWQEVGTDSFGNGGAMRVAPVGFFYFDNMQKLKEAAILSCRVTHHHPLGVAGAVAQAVAVSMAVSLGLRRAEIIPDIFISTVASMVSNISGEFSDRLQTIPLESSGDFSADRERITFSFGCDVTALESVPAAIACFLLTNSLRDAIVMGVNLGGDTDTIGAMAGAIAGAYYGLKAVPVEWLEGLENVGRGRDYVVKLSHEMADVFWRSRGS